MKVRVKMVASDGPATVYMVDIPAGATVGRALEVAGLSADRKDLFVNGVPAELSTVVVPEVTVRDRAAAVETPPQVAVRERARGS
jgi:hypothetical protein